VEQAHRQVGRERLTSKDGKKNPPFKKGVENNVAFRTELVEVFPLLSFVSLTDRE
jgi:hypothetical protein